MITKNAARIGTVLVIAHMIMHICFWLINLIQMLPAISEDSRMVYLGISVLGIVGGIVLDVALLIVFGSLANTNEQLIQSQEQQNLQPRGRVCFVLSIIFTVFTLLVCICSLWSMEAHHEGYMADAFGLFYGSIGLVITSVVALVGIVFGVIWMHKNKAINDSSVHHKRWLLIVFVLATCSMQVLFAIFWLLLRGDLS